MADQDPLPSGWTSFIDPISGNVYYYKEETQETRWLHPNCQTPAQPTNPSQPLIAANQLPPPPTHEWKHPSNPNIHSTYRQPQSVHTGIPPKNCCPPGYKHPPGCEDCDDCFTIEKEDCECPTTHEINQGIKDAADEYAHSWNEFGLELNHELCCCAEFDLSGPCHRLVKCRKVEGEAEAVGKTILSWFHIPYFPAFHRPGWLLRYLVGPFNKQLLNSVVADFCAGLTVALTLIPQVGMGNAIMQ